jgi:hypothetical protein
MLSLERPAVSRATAALGNQVISNDEWALCTPTVFCGSETFDFLAEDLKGCAAVLAWKPRELGSLSKVLGRDGALNHGVPVLHPEMDVIAVESEF